MANQASRLSAAAICGCGLGWLIGLSASPVLHLVVTAALSLAAGAVATLYPTGDRTLGRHASQDPETAADQPTPAEAPVVQKPTIELDGDGDRRMTVVSALVAGVALAATVGVYARANDWLGVNPHAFIGRWRSTGLSDQAISRRLLDHLYPAAAPSPSAAPTAVSAAPEQRATGSAPEQHAAVSGTKAEETGRQAASAPNVVNRGALLSASRAECNTLLGERGEDLRTELRSSTRPSFRRFAARCNSHECLEAAVQELICEAFVSH